jgi:glycosyltransferase involved in cell wall biosynthesis
MTQGRMHVAFMVGSLRMGGAERMMINTANELCKQSRVSFLSLTGGVALKGELSDDVTLHSFENKNSLSSIPALLKFIRKEKPTVLISTQIHVNLIAVLLKVFFGVKTKIILREATSPGSHFLMHGSARWRLVNIAMKWLYPKADSIVAICEAVKINLVESGYAPSSKVEVIYNPVINERFRKAQAEEIDHPFFRSEVPIYISVGRLAPAKNFPLLIEAFSLLVKNRDARLIIIGEGGERKNLEKLISHFNLKEKISLPGEKIYPYSWMRRANTYVLSSLYEGLPNALIEGMACGLQLVSVDCPGGSKEILEDGKCGWLVKMSDAKSLADAMIESLDRPVDKKILEVSVKRFEAETIGQKYFSLVSQLTQ